MPDAARPPARRTRDAAASFHRRSQFLKGKCQKIGSGHKKGLGAKLPKTFVFTKGGVVVEVPVADVWRALWVNGGLHLVSRWRDEGRGVLWEGPSCCCVKGKLWCYRIQAAVGGRSWKAA